eukprot:jgi/Astpho2/5784/Aster-02303
MVDTYNFKRTHTFHDNERAHPVLETLWYPGKEAPMIERANRLDHTIWFEIQEPGLSREEPETYIDKNGKLCGKRGFCSYPTWKEAWPQLSKLEPPRRHVFETLKSRVKPFMDLDLNNPPKELTAMAVMERAEKLLTKIFKDDYEVYLRQEDFCWSVSRIPYEHQKDYEQAVKEGRFPAYKDKLSLHLVISTHYPQVVFEAASDKHPSSSAGAFARKLRELGDELVSPMVDLSAYRHKQKMRTIYSSKPEKHYNILTPENESRFAARPEDYHITWFDEDVKILQVPPEQRSKDPVAMPRKPRKLYGAAAEIDDGTIERVLQLAQKIHPSAYYEKRSKQDLCDPAVGLHFNYTDRSEPCWTGNSHDQQGFVCYLGDYGSVWCRCWSDKCSRRHFLGDISSHYVIDHPLEEPYKADAVHINVQYLSQGLQKEQAAAAPFADAVQAHLAKKFQVLNISSALGTGKTTWLHDHIGDNFIGKSVLLVGYRVSLCHKLAADLADLEFIGYKMVPHHAVPGLANREAYPRVVCQLDSIWRFENDIEVPEFDLVVCDEIEMLLNHISADTLKNHVFIFDLLMGMIASARCGAITLDGLWGSRTYDALSQSGISQKLVINTHKPPQKTFVFTKNQQAWIQNIMADLRDEKNVVVISMAAEGLFQMTGRIRVFETAVVECCVDNNIKLPSSGPGKKRAYDQEAFSDLRTTPEEQIQRIQWTRECVDMGLPTIKIKRNGLNCLIPPSNALLTVSAHNSAQALNSGYNFYREFKRVAQQAGHIVKEHDDDVMRQAVQAESMKDQLTDRQLNLLNGVDLSEDEYDEINTRVIVGLEATTEDKYAVERHQFKLSYGLDRLSAEFLSDVKFQAAGMRMIVQQIVALGSTKGPMRHHHSIMFAEHTRELLDALGFAHMFDDDRHLTDDELVALREVLQQTHFFQNYSANIKIYSPQAKTVIDFTDAQAIVRAVNAVIGKAGLKLTRVKSERKHGHRRSYLTGLSKDLMPQQAERLKIKLEQKINNAHQPLKDYLSNLEIVHYKDLIDLTKDSFAIVH